MAEIILDKSKTALLMADFATSGIGQNPVAEERHTLERAKDVLDAARTAGVFVAYCVSHFRPGYPEVSDRDQTRAARRDSGEVLPDGPHGTDTHFGETHAGGACHREAPYQRLLWKCFRDGFAG